MSPYGIIDNRNEKLVPESVPLARFKAAWNAAKNVPCNPISESNPIFVEGHVELESSVPEGSLQLDNL